jgi:hypothetical protein
VALPLLGYLQAGLFVGARLATAGMHHRALIGRTLLTDTLMAYAVAPVRQD